MKRCPTPAGGRKEKRSGGAKRKGYRPTFPVAKRGEAEGQRGDEKKKGKLSHMAKRGEADCEATENGNSSAVSCPTPPWEKKKSGKAGRKEKVSVPRGEKRRSGGPHSRKEQVNFPGGGKGRRGRPGDRKWQP